MSGEKSTRDGDITAQQSERMTLPCSGANRLISLNTVNILGPYTIRIDKCSSVLTLGVETQHNSILSWLSDSLDHTINKQYHGLINIAANGLAHCRALLRGLYSKVEEYRGNQGHLYQGLTGEGQGSEADLAGGTGRYNCGRGRG